MYLQLEPGDRYAGLGLFAGLGDPTLQIASPKPSIGALVDYLDATVLARGRVTVPTSAIGFLADLDPPDRPTWWKRLSEEPTTLFPTVRVTVELIRVGVSLTPLSNYEDDVIFGHALDEYAIRLHSKGQPCSTDYVPVLGSPFRITSQAVIEQKLGIGGQLDMLVKAGKIGLPISPQDQRRLFWLVYATFPAGINKHVIPQGHIVLDEFPFDKAELTKQNLGRIAAIARHFVAVRKLVGTAPKIVLTGHTDDRGTEQYNIGLADKRIASVDAGLRSAIDGVVPGLSSQLTITTKSFGESKPLVRATTESEHARNRRVEVLMQKPRPRCPRVSVHAVVRRGLKLLPSLGSKEQAQRLNCVLRKVLQKGADDRWVDTEVAQRVFNNSLQMGTYRFGLLRDGLSVGEVFGTKVPDAKILAGLQGMDERIVEGMGRVNQLMVKLNFAATQGIPLIDKMKAMDALRAWMLARIKDDSSIYRCYKDV
jgi:hypothetical protein